MSRSSRLLDLVQILRRHRYPVSGASLAGDLGVSLRTLYRDIATLQAQGADIEGEPGLGYILKPGFLLPPLMFTEDELEALALGARWVASRADSGLASAASHALAKIADVVPEDLKSRLDATSLLVGSTAGQVPDKVDLAEIRRAIRLERIVDIAYADGAGNLTERRIWPVALGYFDKLRMVVAWCELRNDFRHFRTDRISAIKSEDKRYPRRKTVLLKEWKRSSGIPDAAFKTNADKN
ncbi:helix-turn-helix transcriptional regulator [Rhizobium alvei]|uniref:YafY family protein n=1 Tax=Rhizobium alvei TaxID=1132659 RepID=A0ABT8YNY9_9HYPH|nr:YafY family protein [Rhizobium alvei]MDO6965404.1 YafY family protein [Rhizobium alvei]